MQAMSHPFLLALEKGLLLCDGARATLPHHRGVPPSDCLEAGRTVFVAGPMGPSGVGIPASEAHDVSLKIV